jgi:hypothetical protein
MSKVITIESIDHPVFSNISDMEDDLEAINNFAATLYVAIERQRLGRIPFLGRSQSDRSLDHTSH